MSLPISAGSRFVAITEIDVDRLANLQQSEFFRKICGKWREWMHSDKLANHSCALGEVIYRFSISKENILSIFLGGQDDRTIILTLARSSGVPAGQFSMR